MTWVNADGSPDTTFGLQPNVSENPMVRSAAASAGLTRNGGPGLSAVYGDGARLSVRDQMATFMKSQPGLDEDMIAEASGHEPTIGEQVLALAKRSQIGGDGQMMSKAEDQAPRPPIETLEPMQKSQAAAQQAAELEAQYGGSVQSPEDQMELAKGRANPIRHPDKAPSPQELRKARHIRFAKLYKSAGYLRTSSLHEKIAALCHIGEMEKADDYTAKFRDELFPNPDDFQKAQAPTLKQDPEDAKAEKEADDRANRSAGLAKMKKGKGKLMNLPELREKYKKGEHEEEDDGEEIEKATGSYGEDAFEGLDGFLEKSGPEAARSNGESSVDGIEELEDFADDALQKSMMKAYSHGDDWYEKYEGTPLYREALTAEESYLAAMSQTSQKQAAKRKKVDARRQALQKKRADAYKAHDTKMAGYRKESDALYRDSNGAYLEEDKARAKYYQTKSDLAVRYIKHKKSMAKSRRTPARDPLKKGDTYTGKGTRSGSKGSYTYDYADDAGGKHSSGDPTPKGLYTSLANMTKKRAMDITGYNATHAEAIGHMLEVMGQGKSPEDAKKRYSSMMSIRGHSKADANAAFTQMTNMVESAKKTLATKKEAPAKDEAHKPGEQEYELFSDKPISVEEGTKVSQGLARVKRGDKFVSVKRSKEAPEPSGGGKPDFVATLKAELGEGKTVDTSGSGVYVYDAKGKQLFNLGMNPDGTTDAVDMKNVSIRRAGFKHNAQVSDAPKWKLGAKLFEQGVQVTNGLGFKDLLVNKPNAKKAEKLGYKVEGGKIKVPEETEKSMSEINELEEFAKGMSGGMYAGKPNVTLTSDRDHEDGGNVDGVGKTSGANDQGMATAASTSGAKGTGKQKLSADDAVDEGQMKTHKKPIEQISKSAQDMREFMENSPGDGSFEKLQLLTNLRKGEEDIVVGLGVPNSDVQVGETDVGEELLSKAKAWVQQGGGHVLHTDLSDLHTERFQEAGGQYQRSNVHIQGQLHKSITCPTCEDLTKSIFANCQNCGADLQKAYAEEVEPDHEYHQSGGVFLEDDIVKSLIPPDDEDIVIG